MILDASARGTMMIEALTKQMARFPQQVNAVPMNQEEFQEEEVNYVANQGRQGNFQQGYNHQQGWQNNPRPNQNYGWRQEGGPSNRPPYQQSYPTVSEKTSLPTPGLILKSLPSDHY